MPHASQGQRAVQVQTQTQTLSPQQVLLVRLTELPLNELRERIDKELENNPWLQGEQQERDARDFGEEHSAEEEKGTTSMDSSDSYDDEDDGIPREPKDSNVVTHTRELGDSTESFFDHLVAQLGEYSLSDHEKEVMQYLIGSLADDGLLRVPLQQIVDELDIYQNIQTDIQEL